MSDKKEINIAFKVESITIPASAMQKVAKRIEALEEALSCFLNEYEGWPDGEKVCVDMARELLSKKGGE